MCGIKNGEKNSQNREAWTTDHAPGDIVHLLASSGGKAAYPPYGGIQSHPLWGWILYFWISARPPKSVVSVELPLARMRNFDFRNLE